MRIVFFGSDDFAATNLKEVLKNAHQVVACVTGPDKPQGRGMKMAISPIKEIALEYDIPCLQPAALKDDSVVAQLKDFNADLFVVVAYGRLLTQAVLDIPKLFTINVHGSLLPNYRGAAPVNWAILNGDKETGVTIQKVVLALDAGDIITQEKMAIGPEETSTQLRSRMAETGAKLLVKTIEKIAKGEQAFIPQGDKFTYAPKLTKDMGRIDWMKSAQEIHNQIRGLQPWPGAFTIFNGKILKILKSSLAQGQAHPGKVVSINKHGFTVATSQGLLLIEKVQPEAGKPMSAASFISGHKLLVDHQL